MLFPMDALTPCLDATKHPTGEKSDLKLSWNPVSEKPQLLGPTVL